MERRIDVFMTKAMKKSGYCKFTVSNETTQAMMHVIWMFSKNWRYTDAFNHRLILHQINIFNEML